MVLLLGGGPANFVKGRRTIQTFEDQAGSAGRCPITTSQVESGIVGDGAVGIGPNDRVPFARDRIAGGGVGTAARVIQVEGVPEGKVQVLPCPTLSAGGNGETRGRGIALNEILVGRPLTAGRQAVGIEDAAALAVPIHRQVL